MRRIVQAELSWEDLEEAIDDYLAKSGYTSDGSMCFYNDGTEVVFDQMLVPVKKGKSAVSDKTTD